MRLVVAGLASIGAGAIHATAAGNHSEHRQAVVAFVAVAAVQIGWGVLALVRSSRMVGALGVAINGAALAGWVLAKTSGIGFVDGLDQSESVQFADAVAAGLAALAILAVVAATLGASRLAGAAAGSTGPRLVGLATLVTVSLALPGMVSAGSHTHDGGDHAGSEDHAADGSHDGAADEAAHAAGAGAEHEAVETHPFDPTLPIDLGGMEGVTPEEQAQAENLLAVSLLRLPQFADLAATQARGYHTVNDAVTGFEHFINWDLVDDGKILDPDYPESLVYRVNGDQRVLVAAMFMLPNGTPIDAVPALGGDLLQWHVHDDLCFTRDPVAPVVAGVFPPDEDCPEQLQRIPGGPMIHVWIESHPCGPFAALEGVSGGQVPDGETRLCDHAHGST